jgi:hypothetical protein
VHWSDKTAGVGWDVVGSLVCLDFWVFFDYVENPDLSGQKEQ